MELIVKPSIKDWNTLTIRSEKEQGQLEDLVKNILNTVKAKGDPAIRNYSMQFDRVNLKQIKVSEKELQQSEFQCSEELKSAIQLAKSNIETFHSAQKDNDKIIQTMKGVSCWRKSVGIENVGLYIPGGSAPLFSTILMLGIPAKIAGCKNIILCTPANAQGEIHPAILYTAKLLGITNVYKVGGAQAIAAMAYGTQEIPLVDKIFGPGNQYVTKAKALIQQEGVAIDMPAGPSEVLVVTDGTGNPEFIASDLLSQAEHGKDSQVILLSSDIEVLNKTLEELDKQVNLLPRKDIAIEALKNSKAILLDSVDLCIEFSNQYAPEHLILAMDDFEDCIEQVRNAGSVFLGHYSCESAGDYASGTNHTLPTNGFAKSYSGVSLDSFVKKITFQKITKLGIETIGPAIEIMAEAEGLLAHKNAVSVRLNNL